MDVISTLFDNKNKNKHILNSSGTDYNPGVDSVKSAKDRTKHDDSASDELKNRFEKNLKNQQMQSKVKQTEDEHKQKQLNEHNKSVERQQEQRRQKQQTDKNDGNREVYLAEKKSDSVHSSAVSLGGLSHSGGGGKTASENARRLGDI